MRFLFLLCFSFIMLNTSSAQMAGTWKGKFNGKEVTLTLVEAGSDKFTGSYISERNNYALQLEKTDNGFDGRGKDRAAAMTSTFTGTINEKKEITLVITTNWVDQKVEEKIILKRV